MYNLTKDISHSHWFERIPPKHRVFVWHTLNVGTFPKNLENLSASIVAEVTINLRSLRRETTCNKQE